MSGVEAAELVTRLVRSIAERADAGLPDDDLIAACGASPVALIRAAAHAHVAAVHLAELRLDAADAESRAATVLAGAAAAPERPGEAPVLRWWVAHTHGSVLDELGHFDAAQASFHEALTIAGQHHLRDRWGRSVAKQIWVARRRGDSRAMVARLRQLVDAEPPNSHRLNAALGAALVWLGRPQTALYYTRRCLDLPASARERVRDQRELARVLAAVGRVEEASEHLEAAQAGLDRLGSTLGDRCAQALAEFDLSIAASDPVGAERIARRIAAELPGDTSPRRDHARLCVALAQVAAQRYPEAAATLAGVDDRGLAAETRALAWWARASVAEHADDWETTARALTEVHAIVSARYLAMPTVLQIEAELAAGRPDFTLETTSPGVIPEFSRAVATRDQLLMSTAKDLRGPIATFELGADLLTRPGIDAGRVAMLIERGVAEMQLMLDHLRDIDAPAPEAAAAPADLPATVPGAVRAAQPLAAARGVRIEVAAGLGAAAEHSPDDVGGPSERAVTTVLALLVRVSAAGGSVAIEQLSAAPLGLAMSAVLPGQPPGGAASQALTAPTAGAPGWWTHAMSLLAAGGVSLAADWDGPGRIRVTLRPSAPRLPGELPAGVR